MEYLNLTSEQKLVHRLMLESLFLKEAGLLYGKMGVGIAFFDLGERTGQAAFTAQGDELVSGILDGLDFRTNWDFATGLSGIAWGIEYLVQNGYEDCNTNIVCRDIDWKISQLSIVRMDDLSLDTGLEGILHYVLARAKGALAQNSKLPFNPDFLFEIRQVLKGLDRKKMSPSMAYLASEYDYFFTHEAINTYRLDIKSFIQTPEQHDIEQMTCGLKFGLAGLLYKIPGIHDS